MRSEWHVQPGSPACYQSYCIYGTCTYKTSCALRSFATCDRHCALQNPTVQPLADAMLIATGLFLPALIAIVCFLCAGLTWRCPLENIIMPSPRRTCSVIRWHYSRQGYIQACRGLMISAVCLGFFGSIFGLVGMKCTKIGGSDKNKARIACLAGLIFILCGLCSMTGCSLYAHRITSEFFDPSFVAQKYELGAALFIGWAGASLCIIGGSIFCFSIAENSKSPRRAYAYNGAASVMSSRTKIHNSVPDQTSPKHFDKNAYV